MLQKVGIDLVEAMQYVDEVIKELESQRSEKGFESLLKDAKKLATSLDIQLVKPRIPKRSVYRQSSGEDITNSSVSEQSVEAYFRINVFYPTLDSIIIDLKHRFGKHQERAVGMSRLIPAFMDFNSEEEDWIKICSALHMYGSLLSQPEVVVKQEFFCEAEMVKQERKCFRFTKNSH